MPVLALPPLVSRLREAVGVENVLSAQSDLLVYECDGYTIEKNSPDVVVFPRNTADIARVVKICNEQGVPFLPRGAGTSLAGGCLPIGGGVMIVLGIGRSKGQCSTLTTTCTMMPPRAGAARRGRSLDIR